MRRVNVVILLLGAAVVVASFYSIMNRPPCVRSAFDG